jgi:cyclase
MRIVRTLALLTLILCTSLEAQSKKELDVTRLADGVYGLTWRAPLVDPIEANVLVIVNESDVVLVDSSFLPSTARRIVGEVKKVTPKPVRYVINTHWHNDHVQGNVAYREAWPAVEFISHRHTRQDAIDYAWGQIPKGLKQAEESRERLKRWLTNGKDDDGNPIDEKRRARIEAVLPVVQMMIDETSNLPVVAPDITFEESFVIHRGERTIEARYLGLGNTRGDVVVLLPKERLVATGDLVVRPEPFGFGSYYKEWIDTLGKLAAFDVDQFFPGHGEVMKDRTYIETLQGLLRSLTTEVDAAVASGATLEETKKRVTLEEWKKKLAGEDAAIARSFDAFFISPAVERAWKQAKNEPGSREQGQ